MICGTFLFLGICLSGQAGARDRNDDGTAYGIPLEITDLKESISFSGLFL
jgi:hypothetical protein